MDKMLCLLINEAEQKEIEYMVKRELEELLLDLEDQRIDSQVKQSMRIRYENLFQLLLRVAGKEECLPYIPAKNRTK